ncbi:geranylgeranyl diphosphate synthase [Pyronema domesticum]|uniref:Similar to Geranylgeranyl pyrophosphate synthase acc. no. P24322 n=1 Tax=Pyronema omphalodes (strain CBS 100304) TaxID=1076935 RepID=U4KWU6_PYROM|nr:geranylgeranyl diphosphate synthase [Pyronema domesticum]CCX06131.1 Similar to Geranylgeranyl pyrophosphate synthase; acc. no. P24322 [Pyronema omphalodes CBS 100304]
MAFSTTAHETMQDISKNPVSTEMTPTSDLDFELPATWTEHKEKILLGPYDYLVSYPGKDIRKQLIAAFNIWLSVPAPVLSTISSVVAQLHTASLLVDDVEDNSILRRGVPVAHSIFGVAQTINTANYVYFLALQELAKLENTACLSIYTEELLNLHRGQGMELHWRDSLTCPTKEDYLEMVSNKTGGLFRLAVKLMQTLSPSCDADYVPLVNTIGLIFQIRDDYINLQSSQYQSAKGFCEDLTEGKFSFPIIHSIRSDPENMQLINILKQRTELEEVKKYAVEYMEKRTGSFEYTRGVLRELDQRARKMVQEHGGNEMLMGILDMMKVPEER